jgi:hypothetical protein
MIQLAPRIVVDERVRFGKPAIEGTRSGSADREIPDPQAGVLDENDRGPGKHVRGLDEHGAQPRDHRREHSPRWQAIGRPASCCSDSVFGHRLREDRLVGGSMHPVLAQVEGFVSAIPKPVDHADVNAHVG